MQNWINIEEKKPDGPNSFVVDFVCETVGTTGHFTDLRAIWDNFFEDWLIMAYNGNFSINSLQGYEPMWGRQCFKFYKPKYWRYIVYPEDI